MGDTSSSSIVINNFTSSSKFIHLSNPYRGQVGHHSKMEIQGPCENDYKKYCLNGGECCYLIDDIIVGCNCTWLYGGKPCEMYAWLDHVILKNFEKTKNFKLISDTL